MKRPAVFLDRDGTLVHPEHYPSRPDQLHLYENIGSLLREIQDINFALVMITNQSGIAHGYFSESDLESMHMHLRAQLVPWGVEFAGVYYCPHHPDGIIPTFAIPCACRKPQPGMLLQAASDLNLDLARSWFVGDILDDVEAGNRATCHTVLVDLGTEQIPASSIRTPTFVARNIIHALQLIKKVSLLETEVDLLYRPSSWLATNESMSTNRSVLAKSGEGLCQS